MADAGRGGTIGGVLEKIAIAVASPLILAGIAVVGNVFVNGWIISALGGVTKADALRDLLPRRAVVAIPHNEACPAPAWRMATELEGVFPLGAGSSFDVSGGHESFALKAADLPPHRHLTTITADPPSYWHMAMGYNAASRDTYILGLRAAPGPSAYTAYFPEVALDADRQPPPGTDEQVLTIPTMPPYHMVRFCELAP